MEMDLATLLAKEEEEEKNKFGEIKKIPQVKLEGFLFYWIANSALIV